jgi:predicted RNA binding protein YcfA (HicA-like mRNA interferase family)
MKKFTIFQEDLRNWFNPSHPKGGWKRLNSKGEVVGPCAREPGEPKPKCMSNAQRAALSKKERASAVRRKRAQDPNPERKGEPINVKSKVDEAMEILNEKNKPTNPELWSRAVSLARQKFDVYPSAYANGWAAKWYKSKGGGWRSVSEGKEEQEYDYEGDMAMSDLRSIIHNAQQIHDLLEPNTNMPEWCQSKITLAEDYLSTVANYMRGEMNEEVEIQENLMVSPMKPSSQSERNKQLQIKNKHQIDLEKERNAEREREHKRNMERQKYRDEYISKKVKEEVEQLDEMPGANMDTRAVHSHLKKRGWKLSRTAGSHDVYTHDKAEHHISVPRHKQLKAPLVKGILKQAEVNEEVINEISAETKKSYIEKAKTAVKELEPHAKKGEYKDLAKNLIARRKKGIAMASEQATSSGAHEGRFISGEPKKPFKNPTIVTSQKVTEGTASKLGQPSDEVPFTGAIKPRTQKVVVDKSGAQHGPMSRVKHLAKMAARKQAGMKTEEMEPDDSAEKTNTPAKRSLSKTAGMVKDLADKAKKKGKDKPEAFQPEPELSSQIVKV